MDFRLRAGMAAILTGRLDALHFRRTDHNSSNCLKQPPAMPLVLSGRYTFQPLQLTRNPSSKVGIRSPLQASARLIDIGIRLADGPGNMQHFALPQRLWLSQPTNWRRCDEDLRSRRTIRYAGMAKPTGEHPHSFWKGRYIQPNEFRLCC